MRPAKPRLLPLLPFLIASLLSAGSHAASRGDPAFVKQAVDQTIQPLMERLAIPGMAVAVTIDGKHYLYNYGLASKQEHLPVTDSTLFEIGSLSKTFTATLAAYAQEQGKLSLADTPGKYLPALRGSPLDQASLLNLATQTSGLPLFVPDSVSDDDKLMDYLKHWQPSQPIGSYRVYSNLGIGALGMISAQSLGMRYADAIEKRLFPALGLRHSYVEVPADKMPDYAQGYTKQDAPTRMSPGVLAAEAYGLRASAADLARFLDANMRQGKLDSQWQRAVDATHVPYFQAGVLTQDLIWEQYPYPLQLKQLLAGNAPDYIYQGMPARKLPQPQPAAADVLINKTGSTNGFSAYVAFLPARKLGVVILANKSYPLDERVSAGYRILGRLDGSAPSPR
ncbi:class C beta-lactamase [Chromobacterium sphagni]|uniref:Beta-lactamase n=1 Tax=Chromobacterium sphagni TaxID=1903179 RepID=A0A1S1X3P1_9NEIS|nr:class C beta-lactamase [Chromobacterium sphagni]OHX14040.1 class C beta-lactamase [Chromobacterium sphagni]OHX20249.1 class C beta-lactamase [Chromobacterium sphagni]